LDDILAKLWVPRELPSKAAGGGVFDHLRNQPKAKALELPAVNITWEKFAREILGDVLQMEIMAPSNGNYCGLVTATDPDAPAIIQWDGLEGHPRNPVSLYVYHNGSAASNWGLTAGWVKVTAVFRGPHKWQEPSKFKHQADSVCFAIDGCRDSRPAELCLFPEILKAEFHGIRAVVEAHSKSGGITGREDGNANGLIMNSGSPVTIRVRTATGLANYTIDRLD
jgi:hypothetical protein